jgi:hypothetical protein
MRPADLLATLGKRARLVPVVTAITKADRDAQAATARRMSVDPTDYYPRSFETWPVDPDVFAPPLAIDCADLDRGMGR